MGRRRISEWRVVIGRVRKYGRTEYSVRGGQGTGDPSACSGQALRVTGFSTANSVRTTCYYLHRRGVVAGRFGRFSRRFKPFGARLAGDAFVDFPRLARPAFRLTKRADAAAGHYHRPDECHGQLADRRPFAEQCGVLILGQVVAVVGGAEVGLGFIETAEGVAEELDEFFLRATAEAFGHVGHDRLGRVVDLDDESLIAGERRFFGEVEDVARPDAGSLPEEEFGEGASGGHAYRVLSTEYGVQSSGYEVPKKQGAADRPGRLVSFLVAKPQAACAPSSSLLALLRGGLALGGLLLGALGGRLGGFLGLSHRRNLHSHK
jgi:hypothetical protein